MIHGGASSTPLEKNLTRSARITEEMWRELTAAVETRAEQLIEVRRAIHASPERSGHEQATTRRLAEHLRQAGLAPRIGRDDTGIVADLDLGAPADTFIALRCELDAVQVDDEKGTDYRSRNEGLCHACGHDVHSSILLGTASIMQAHREALRALRLRHNLRFIFQPAEEAAVGALSMIEQGATQNVEAMAAIHVDPFRPVGTIGLRKGAMTGACRLFRVRIHGQAGHSARPFEAVDPIPAASNVINQFYQLAPRSMDSRYPLALTVSSMEAGAAFNAIPHDAVIRGTLRTTREEDEHAVRRRMAAVCEGVGRSTGCDVHLDYLEYAPPTNNDPHLTELAAAAGHGALGAHGVSWIDVPSLGAEDFAFFQQQVPGVFVRLGAALEDGRPPRPLHSSFFDIDERAIAVGTRFMLRAGLDLAALYSRSG